MIAIIKIKNDTPDRIIIPLDTYQSVQNVITLVLEYINIGKKISFHVYEDDDFFELENTMKCEE